MAGLALWGRIFWRLIGGRDGDHRDWPAIDRWAAAIGADLSRLRDAAGRQTAT
jgi:menaquinone-dependent protoporphyrinogen oxidase